MIEERSRALEVNLHMMYVLSSSSINDGRLVGTRNPAAPPVQLVPPPVEPREGSVQWVKDETVTENK